MAGLVNAAKLCAGLFAATFFLTNVASPSYAETGSVRLKVTSVGFIVGIGGGSGVLNFRGKTYRLGVSGVSAGTIGAAGMDLVGTASNCGPPQTSRGPTRPLPPDLPWRAAQRP